MGSTKNIFAIYASHDKEVLLHLLLHLQRLETDFNVAIWSDDAIYPGQPWKPQNASRLDDADIFLLLLSNAFMYSEFIKQDEFKAVIDRYKDGRATVIPILLDDCPWDVEFTSDDYNFNFSELRVFPKNEKPIGDRNLTDEVFKEVADYVGSLITSSRKKSVPDESNKKSVKNILNTKKEEQIAIDFFEEGAANNKAEKEKKQKNEVEAVKRVEEKNILGEEAEAKEVIRKEKRLRQKAEIQKRIEKEKRLKEKAKNDRKIEEEAEAKRVAEEEKRKFEEEKVLREIAKKKRDEISKSEIQAEQEKRLGEVVPAEERVIKRNRLAGYNYQFKTAKVAEAKRVAEEEKRKYEETKAQREVTKKKRDEISKSESQAELEKRLRGVVTALKGVMKKILLAVKHNYRFKSAREANLGPKVTKKKSEKIRTHFGFLIGALIIFGLLIYLFTGDAEKQSTTFPEIETTEVAPDAETNTKNDSGNLGDSFVNLAVGDTYEEGIVFSIDQSGKTGKIAHTKDFGPMPWKNAMDIDEQLGEGWRLPNMDELQLMYRTIGQGATNSGQFADELYWSATPYDDYQARLLRFRDGNASYHYNNRVEHRKFYVRAVRDFSR